MTRFRWIVLGVLALLLTVCGAPVGLLVYTFAGLSPVVDGDPLPGGGIVVQDGYVSAFLVPTGEGRYLLVDAGNDATGAAIDRALAARGVDRTAVDAILFTHGHPDHTAGCGLFPGASLYALAPELPLLKAEVSPKGPLPWLLGMDPAACADRVVGVKDGVPIGIGAIEVKPFALPGHTAGSTAWWIGGELYMGDAASALSSGELTVAPWLFSDDQDEAVQSLVHLHDRVEGLGVKGLAFSHTGRLDGEDALARYAEDHR